MIKHDHGRIEYSEHVPGQDDKIKNLESVSEELDSIQNTLKFEGDS